MRAAGGDVVGVRRILTEARDWKETLGADASLIYSLAHIPQFTPRDGPVGADPRNLSLNASAFRRSPAACRAQPSMARRGRDCTPRGEIHVMVGLHSYQCAATPRISIWKGAATLGLQWSELAGIRTHDPLTPSQVR